MMGFAIPGCSVAVGVEDLVGDAEGVVVSEGDGVTVTVLVTVGVVESTVGVNDGVSVLVDVGTGDGVAVALSVGIDVSVRVAVGTGVSVRVGVALGGDVGTAVVVEVGVAVEDAIVITAPDTGRPVNVNAP
jgi:hypothetical protein